MSESNPQKKTSLHDSALHHRRGAGGAVGRRSLCGKLAVCRGRRFCAFLWLCTRELTALSRGGTLSGLVDQFRGLAISVPLMMFYSSLVIIPILALLSFIVLLVVMRRENPDLVDICMSELPMLTVVLPGMCLFGILDTEPRSLQALLLVLVFAIAVGGDTFAYFVGKRHWRAQAVPAHQPQQNRGRSCRAGWWGSILCAVAAGRIFTLCFPDFSGFPPIWADMLCGLFGGIAGQMGDLFASMVKTPLQDQGFRPYLSRTWRHAGPAGQHRFYRHHRLFLSCDLLASI